MASELQQMIDGLGLEIAAVRKRGSTCLIEVIGGKRVEKTPAFALYEFPMKDDLKLHEDSPIKLRFQDKEVEGAIVSLYEAILTISLQEDLGEEIPFAQITIDTSFLLERLQKRLKEVQAGTAQFHGELADKLLHPETAVVGEQEPPVGVAVSQPPLNDEKNLLIRKALGSELLFVWGPPGTGKTTSLAHVVEGFYRQNLSVLLVSNTNVAVDTALEKIASRLRHEPEFEDGAVIRLGVAVKPEVRDSDLGELMEISKVATRLGEKLEPKKQLLHAEKLAIETGIAPMLEAMGIAKQRSELSIRMSDKKGDWQFLKTAVAKTTVEQEKISAEIKRLAANLQRAESINLVMRWIEGLNPTRLRKAIDIATAKHAQQARELTSRLESFSKAEEEVRQLQERIDILSVSLKTHPAVDSYLPMIDEAKNKVLKLEQAIQEIEKAKRQMRQHLINNCRVLATTAYQTYVNRELSRSFDVAIIDEASMLIFPLTYYAVGLAGKAAIVAGDFRQLPPIVTSKDEPLVEEWLRRDAFVVAGIPDAVESDRELPYVCSLQTQFRMRSEICDCINQHFYSDRPLRADPEVANQSSDMPLGTSSLLYVDTSAFQPWASTPPNSYSRYNIFHALLVRNLVTFLADKGYLPPTSHQERLGIVSPYAAQARLISALIEDRLHHPASFAATVHRFQGNEKDTMIVDLTDSPVLRLGKFLSATHCMEDGARLLNVALSRARCHVILVANFAYLNEACESEMITHQLLDYFKQHGSALEVGHLLPLGDADWTDALEQLHGSSATFDLQRPGAFSASSFQSAFSNDLRNAKKSIVIFSPFITRRGITKWMDAMQLALRNGVTVRVVTRPQGDQGSPLDEDAGELIESLRESGCTVELRSRMHEKLAMIDEQVLWHGSLNILSHRDTTESMLRLLGTSTCDEITKIVSPPLRETVVIDIDISKLQSRPCPMPGCGGTMNARTGKFGPFYGCSKFRSGCSHTERIRSATKTDR